MVPVMTGLEAAVQFYQVSSPFDGMRIVVKFPRSINFRRTIVYIAKHPARMTSALMKFRKPEVKLKDGPSLACNYVPD